MFLSASLPKSAGLSSRRLRPPEGIASAALSVHQEEQTSALSNRNLRMIPSRLQLPVPLQQSSMQFVSTFHSCLKNRRSKTMRLAPRCIQYQQSMLSKNRPIELGKCPRQRLACTVSSSKPLHCIGVAEQFPGAINQWRDGFIQDHTANRNSSFGRCFVSQFAKLTTRREGHMIHFGEVMVVA